MIFLYTLFKNILTKVATSGFSLLMFSKTLSHCILTPNTFIFKRYFCFITECKDPKACTILLRGASKDILNEVDRNLQDALAVTRNVVIEPKLVPGGGAVEMAVAQLLTEKAKGITGIHQRPYRTVAKALEVIPRTLIQNCGGNTIRTLTALRVRILLFQV